MNKTRIFFSDNGTLVDWTIPLGNYKVGNVVMDFSPAQDYIFVGNVAPFNHFFLKLGNVVNVLNASIAIEYWDGNSWESVIELFDETEGLAKSGFISWVPNKDAAWDRSNTNYGGQTIPGLTSVNIYDLYWIRISITGAITPSVVISWLGQKFTDDFDLGSEYPELVRNNVISAFETGKTNYEDQHVRAAEIIVHELQKNNIIWTKNQILDREAFKLASVSKVAEIVFNAFGDDYTDQKQRSRQEFDSRMKKVLFMIDLNQDGRLDISEIATKQGFLTR